MHAYRAGRDVSVLSDQRSVPGLGPIVRSWRGTAGAPPSSMAVPRKARLPASWSLARSPGHAAESRPTDCASRWLSTKARAGAEARSSHSSSSMRQITG